MKLNKILLSLALAASCLTALGATPVRNFDVNMTYKSARATYRCVGDSAFGADVAVYSRAGVSVQWPKRFGDNNLNALQDSLLSQAFDATGRDIDKAIKQFIERPEGYGDMTLEPVDELPEAADDIRLLEKFIDVSSIGFCERFIVFKMSYFSDGGGAHPNFFTHFLNYDIKQNLVLDFNDIFTDGASPELLTLVKEALFDKYYADSIEELEERSGIFVDQIFVSQDVFLTGERIVFHYNPYDIGPWSAGEINVAIPVDTLEPYLSDAAKRLYGIEL